jgi:hypothetical protein
MVDKLLAFLLAFLMFIMLTSCGVVLILESLNMEIGVEKVPCYDRYGNLIEDLVCDNETTQTDKSSMLFLGVMLIFVGIAIPYMIYSNLTWSWD